MALKRLDQENGWQVAAGDPDIRGWRVSDAAGAEVGTIDDLLFDSEDQRVKYASVGIRGTSVLLPVNFLDVDREHHRVVARGYTRDMLMALRPYDEDVWDESVELEHRRGHVPEGAEPAPRGRVEVIADELLRHPVSLAGEPIDEERPPS